ncbi:MAG: hypothetical protein ACKVP0_04090, partial [Pirellulaceae bacterium]
MFGFKKKAGTLHRLDQPLVRLPGWSMSIRRLANGTVVLGQIGSGKTRCVRDTILAAEMACEDFAGIANAVKPSDADELFCLAEDLNVLERVIPWGPQTGQRCNFFRELAKGPGTVSAKTEIMVQALEQVREVMNNNRSSGGGESRFWEEASKEELR